MSTPGAVITLDPPRAVPGRSGSFTFVSRRDGAVVHTDEFRPAVSSRVTKFVRETMDKAYPATPEHEWPVTVVEGLVSQFAAWAVEPPEVVKPAPPTSPDDPRAEALAKMPANIRAEAEELLGDTRLIERVSSDIRDAGVVGEAETALALYLVGTSAQLAEPLAAVVRGPSSSGKSFLVETVASLFPPEVTLRATDMSPNALYYFKPGELRHRWVVAGERSRVEDDDRAEATRALREMISSGRLSKAVATKEADVIVSKVVVQEGPIAFTETTTLEQIFAEDANRCLIFNTDERDEQTRRILDATAARAAGHRRDPSAARLLHHAVQRLLPRIGVVVPFAPDLSALLPASCVEERRDLPKVLRLVQASALLRHRQRPRDDQGRVIAAPADYQLAARLAGAALSAERSGISEPIKRCFESLRSQFGLAEFNSNQAELAVAKSRSSVRAWLAALARRGLLEQVEMSKGPNPARWRLTGSDLSAGESYLPPAQDVWELFRARTLGRAG